MPRWVKVAAIPFAGLPVLGYMLMAHWLPTHPSDDLPHKLAVTFMAPCWVGFYGLGFLGPIAGCAFWYLIGLAILAAINRARQPRDPHRPRISLLTWFAIILTGVVIAAAWWIGENWNPD